jgi:hypothetical protein
VQPLIVERKSAADASPSNEERASEPRPAIGHRAPAARGHAEWCVRLWRGERFGSSQCERAIKMLAA